MAFSFIFRVADTVASTLGLCDKSCRETLFVKRDILNVVCLKVLVAKCLGWVMTVLSAVVKAPQIRNMLKAGAATGLSAPSVYCETFMYLCSVVYFGGRDWRDDGSINSFADYGENVNLLVQNAVIVSLMWSYNRTSTLERAAVCGVLAAFAVWGLGLSAECGPLGACWKGAIELKGSALEDCLEVRPCQALLIALPMPLMLMARLPQILANFRNGHTGILSVVTLSMNSAGSLARIFTTFQAKAGVDHSALCGFLLSFLCNFTLATQCVIYRKNTVAVLEATTSKQQAKKTK
mmetsp:Transcript_66523/g.130469  ORF Transcript_66523/g.130469 Transcript_66523/m.130469 type:complete len:293 (+) Transcript_66523:33-911(+)